MGLLFVFTLVAVGLPLFFYVCAPAISSGEPAAAFRLAKARAADTGDSPEPSLKTSGDSSASAGQNTDTAATSTNTDNESNNQSSLQALNTAELRQVSGKEGITFDTRTYDKTIEKKAFLDEDGNNDNESLTLAPIEIDMRVGQFTVDVKTDEESPSTSSFGSSIQVQSIETDIPAIEGHFTFGILMPGSTKSPGSVGVSVQYGGGGSITVTPK